MSAAKATKNQTTAADVDAFLASLPDATRTALEALRGVIRAAAPEATENISYQVPTFNYRGQFLVSYSASNDRCSLFVRNLEVMDQIRDALKPYDTSGATVHFSPAKPLPDALVRQLVKARMAQTDAGRT